MEISDIISNISEYVINPINFALISHKHLFIVWRKLVKNNDYYRLIQIARVCADLKINSIIHLFNLCTNSVQIRSYAEFKKYDKVYQLMKITYDSSAANDILIIGARRNQCAIIDCAVKHHATNLDDAIGVAHLFNNPSAAAYIKIKK